jgi:hypothetical protein
MLWKLTLIVRDDEIGAVQPKLEFAMRLVRKSWGRSLF